MHLISRLLTCAVLVFLTATLYGQAIYVQNFENTPYSHPYTGAPSTLNANLSGSSWSNSLNSWTSFAGASGQSLAISNASGTPTLRLTLQVASGYQASITSFSFWSRRSNTGATNWTMSINGTNVGSGSIGTGGAGSGTVNVAGPVNNLTGTITVVLTLSGGTNSQGTFRFDDFTLNGTVTSAGCTAPTLQGSNIVFPDAGTNSLDVNWTNGNGAGRVVVMNTSNSGFTAPVNGSNPTPNTAYSGSGLQVIYNGTGSGPVTVTGLTPGTTYWFRVYEYCSPDRTYLTSGAATPGTTDAGNTISTTGTYGPICNIAATPVNVTYTTTGTFTGTFSAQLSDASGSFASPTLIGTGTSPIAAEIPAGLPAGTGYRIRVVNTTPAVNGSNNGSNIRIYALPVVNLGNDTAYCAGTPFSLSLNAGNAGATYNWNNGAAATQTFSATTAGTYRVKVSFPGGCETIDSLTVTENARPTVNLGNDTAYCAGTAFNLTLDAQNAGAAYNWNSGAANTQTFTVTTAGNYSVSVTDANGCANSDQVTVTENALPTVRLGNDTAYCAGTAFNVVLDAQNAGASYNWNNGAAHTQTFAATGAGTYSVTVTDANGCENNDQLTVTENALPTVNLGNDTAYCTGTAFSLTMDAQNAGASYNWNNGAANTQTFAATAAGNYSVTVTDANGCENDDLLTVTENALPSVDLGDDAVYCEGTAFSLVLDAGNAGATYDWNNGTAATQTYTATTAGIYSVTVTDINGCEGQGQLTVTENARPVVNLGNDTAYCAGTAFNLTLNAQNAGASYDWNNGTAHTQTFAVTTAGTYSVTVTGLNGCETDDQITVTENSLPTVELEDNTFYCTGTAFSLPLDAGNAGAGYLWNNGSTAQIITATQAGTYSVTVTDANGCIGRDSVEITEKPLPVIVLGNDTAFCEGSTFSLVLDAGNPGSSYSWNGGAANTRTFTATQAGTYTVNVTDVYGCSSNADIRIDELDAPVVNLGADVNTSNTSHTLDAGPGFTSYLWSPGGQTTRQITVSQSGTYTVRVTNTDGCSATDNVQVTLGTGSASIHEAAETLFSVFPNPTNGKIGIRTERTGHFTLAVIGLNGQILFTQNVYVAAAGQTVETDLSQLADGIYLLRLAGADLNHTRRIVLSR